MIDDDHPLAQAFDVPGVVAGEKDGRAFLLIQVADGVADLLPGYHIQANRRLIF